jgi:type II secretory pathway pseudopilin PulG
MKKTNMKKGITLIEIILAIVLVAIIAGLTIPKLMANSERAEIKQVITSDVKSIVEAAIMWKKSSSASNGNFRSISTTQITSRLPDSMATDTAQGLIFSSGLTTGSANNVGTDDNRTQATGVVYTITWAMDATNHTESGRFSIGMNIQNGADDLNWNNNIRAYALDVFTDVIEEISDGDRTPVTGAHTTNGTAGVDFGCETANANGICFHSVRVN